MIVKDKEKTLSKAHDIATQLIDILRKEVREFDDGGDPAEQIYLTCHTLANLIFRIIMSLSGLGETYNIENLSIPSLYQWIESIGHEYVEAFMGKQ